MGRLSLVPEQPKQESKCLIRHSSSLKICQLAPQEFWNSDALTLWLPMRSVIEEAFTVSTTSLQIAFAVLFSYRPTQYTGGENQSGVLVVPLFTADLEDEMKLNALLDSNRKALQSAERSAEFEFMLDSSRQTFKISIGRDTIFGESMLS